MESVLNYEQLVHEFEKISGTTYPSELKSATLIRCSENRLREHLQLTIKESTTYTEIREAVLSHEQASTTWSQEAIMKSLTLKPNDARDETLPLDVDRVEKGKGKGKQKGKEKGKGWWSGFAYGGGRGYPKGKGRGFGRGGKSKGKQKGKKGGKSKNKQKGKTGGKKTDNVDQNQCRICFGFGHWSRDSPQRVQQVEQQPQVQQQQRQTSGTTSVASGCASTALTLNTAARRTFHIGPPPSTTGSLNSSVRLIIQDITGRRRRCMSQCCDLGQWFRCFIATT